MPYDPRTGMVTFPGYDLNASTIMKPSKSGLTPAGYTDSQSDRQKMMQIMTGGNFADTLTGGDKLLALSALLGSVARGSKTTPQEVIADIRKQQLGRIEAKVIGDSLKARAAASEAFLKTLPENERNMFMLLDADSQMKYMLERQKGRKLTDAEEKIVAAGIPLDSERAQRILDNVASAQGIITVTGPAGTTYIQAGDLTRGVGAGAPAPAGVTFTPLGAPSNAGGPTPPASGGFRKR